MTNSMTGFATAQGASDAATWVWDIRGVNGKGLDLRLRLPDSIEGLEAAVRSRATAVLGRGNVTVSLKLTQPEAALELAVNEAQVRRIASSLQAISEISGAQGLDLGVTRPIDILNQRGVLEAQEAEPDTTLLAKLLATFDEALAGFQEARAQEGAALHGILSGQVDEIATLTAAAQATVGDRTQAARASLEAALERLAGKADSIDPDRMAQELALIAVKSDISEELDRLVAHIDAARELLAADGPVGRKFDFLAQEFNREANTLCSKSGHAELTRIGLDLKVLIDRMREQVQNVE